MNWDIQRKFFKYFVLDKRGLFKYAFLSFVVGILELFGIALIYPFMNKLLSEGYQTSTIILGCIIVTAFIIKNVFMVFYNFLQADFVKKCEVKINEIFMNYFLLGNYNSITKIPLSQKLNLLGFLPVNAINNYLVRILNLVVNFFVFFLISGFLFYKFFYATLITVICSVIFLGSQAIFFKRKTSYISNKILKANENINQACSEPLLNLKGIKIQQSESFFLKRYHDKLENLRTISRDLLFYGMIPPYITEPFIIFLLLILVIAISVENSQSTENLIASYAVVATAIFRLAPIISRIQVNITGLNAALPTIEELVKSYEAFKLNKIQTSNQNKHFADFKNSLELKDVCFSYDFKKNTLENINLKINKGDFIGLVGQSGAGKTTIVDIISGLLEIKSGELFLDENLISTNKIPSLNIGYIPQEISVISGSIRENIAFAKDEIDDNRVIESLKKACLYDFIVTNYSDGIYASPFVDSTGFSQGQKQRLAIARALYSNPDIIIMDEGTSALDLKTEDEICSVIEKLKGEKTIIVIAHRLSTIKNCDYIYILKSGNVTASGTFDELYQNNPEFKTLVELNNTNSVHQFGDTSL